MAHSPTFGTVLSWNGGSGTTFTEIGNIGDLDGPGVTRGDIDVTNHQSVDAYREFLPGLKDGGVISVPLHTDLADTEHVDATTGLLSDFDNVGCTLALWRIVLDGCGGTATWAFSGYLNDYSQAFPVEGELMTQLQIKVSGKPTLTVI